MREAWMCNHGVINNERSQCVKCAASGDARTPNATQQLIDTLRALLAAKEEECGKWLSELEVTMKMLDEATTDLDMTKGLVTRLRTALNDLMRPWPAENMVSYLDSEFVAVEVEWGSVREARKLLED
jgi:hypothetical protein